jgi:hypothetical protein
MIDPGDIVDLLQRDPFERFRIHMSDGHAVEIMNPELVTPMETALFIALPGDGWELLSYLQMTRPENAEVRA